MYFCIMNYIGTKGEVCRQLKIFSNSAPPQCTPLRPLPPPPPTHTHTVVLPVLFLILCSFVIYTTGRLMFLSLCPRSPFVLAFWSPRLGKRELICVLLVHLFVCFARVFLFFFSSSWCRGLAAVCDCGILWTVLLTLFHPVHEPFRLTGWSISNIITVSAAIKWAFL